MRQEPKKITRWDWPETETVADGYEFDRVPKLSRENFDFLADKYNELLAFVLEDQEPQT